MTEITEEHALTLATAYCSTAEHCLSEVTTKLQNWGIDRDAIERILNHLESEKYIDQERYCAAYINDKIRLAKWGKNKVSQGLYIKKISSEIVWRHLNLIDKESYLDGLKGLLATKRKSVRAPTEYELNGKLIRFAISRGFDFCDIRLCIQLPADYEDEDRM